MMTANVCRRRFGIRDVKRPNRERETLIREITRLVHRMKACLVRFGVRGFDPTLRKAADRLEKLITPDRVRLPPLTGRDASQHGAATPSWRANPIDRASLCHALIVL
jgi:transposase